MKPTFKEYLLAEVNDTDSQLQQLKMQQFQAMTKKNDQDKLADTNINRFQKQITVLTLKKAAEDQAAEQKQKGEKTPTETPSGTETTQKMAPSARIGFGTTFASS